MSVADRVQSIIESQGQTVTFQKITTTARDVNTLTKSKTVTEYTTKAHFRLFRFDEIAGLIQDGDSQCRIAAKSLTVIPTTRDKIVTAYRTFNIYQVDTRFVGDEMVEHILRARAADI